MKYSKYNIIQDYRDRYLVYNTLSTSMIEIEKPMYENIFQKREFNKYPNEIKALLKMGFLVADHVDEDKEQEKIRQTVIDNNSGKIANIIIAPTLECNAHCFYCFEKGFRKGTMSNETAEALVEHLVSNWNGKHLGITWFGGEPLMATEIITHISKKLSDAGVIFSSKIVTNGLLLNDTVIEHSKSDWHVDKIQVSVDAIGEEYNKIKNFDKSIEDPFSIIINNIVAHLSA